jgi:hypothetical protein
MNHQFHSSIVGRQIYGKEIKIKKIKYKGWTGLKNEKTRKRENEKM